MSRTLITRFANGLGLMPPRVLIGQGHEVVCCMPGTRRAR
jgi:hypothetical protein